MKLKWISVPFVLWAAFVVYGMNATINAEYIVLTEKENCEFIELTQEEIDYANSRPDLFHPGTKYKKVCK